MGFSTIDWILQYHLIEVFPWYKIQSSEAALTQKWIEMTTGLSVAGRQSDKLEYNVEGWSSWQINYAIAIQKNKRWSL